ncbi:MAG TPA: P1 family peptidase [Syntrophorhabdaceae bacterium]|nr:P1 family peptidase [Syntrophorhabdaceae bacterium]
MGETMIKEIPFSDFDAIKIGHADIREAATGCTVIISEQGAITGVDVRGGAPGTRETDLLAPTNLIEKVNAVFLAGGSAFGLDAAAGIMQFLEEKHIGFDVRVTRVPIVTGAVLFDLTVGDSRIRPDKQMGYQACVNAHVGESRQGNVGAGTGATVGKIMGVTRAMKSGLGMYALKADELKVGAIVAVNCLGDVIDPATGEVLAGVLNEDGKTIANTEEIMVRAQSKGTNLFGGNTTVGVVVTNASLTKAQATKVASMSQNAYARTMRPAHTMFDGDTIFAMALGETERDVSVVGMLAARAMEHAIIAAVKNAGPLYNLKCYRDTR